MSEVGLQKKVAVGMSGGVDSSVSAYLLKEQGYDVTGVYIQCWDSRADGCRADEDRADAAKVAANLGIPFVHLDFIKQYKEKVIQYFYSEYALGRTPNPDVMCNKEIKFGLFLDWALKNDFDFVATGHYAMVKCVDGVYQLWSGVDPSKDQSYFLYLLGQEQLSHTIFPVGEMYKKDVRDIATKAGLHISAKPDSMGICFIGEVDIREFIKKELPVKPGNVVNSLGEVMGNHQGVHLYTVGQRHGFVVDKYVGLPLYVVGKNVEKNELIVGFAKEVVKKSFEIDSIHWVGDSYEDFKCKVRIRHLGDLHDAHVKISSDIGYVELDDEVFGVAPGQMCVFYLDGQVLGGGVIRNY